jgi:glycosyltransferase involved in cell wall biosynthesis
LFSFRDFVVRLTSLIQEDRSENSRTFWPYLLPFIFLVLFLTGVISDKTSVGKIRCFRFLVAGGGSRRARFEASCRERSIDNVLFGPYCDRADLGTRLAQGHIGLVTQRPESLGSVVPSKTYGIMAAGRPILFIGPRQATPARIVEKYDCGWQIEPGDARGLVELLETLAHRPDLIHQAGALARQAFEQHYDRPIAVARLCAILGLTSPVQAPLTTRLAPLDVPLRPFLETRVD